jgi:4-hydroxybenzoyl-CoA thioesterase
LSETLFRTATRIRFQDCDPAGIVYYPNFLDKAEAAIEDWMSRVLGESYREWIFAERRGMPRVRVACDFLKPCRMGERLILALYLHKLGRTSMELAVRGSVAGEERLKISLVLVNISLESHKAIPFGAALRAKLERYLELSQAAT